MTQKTQMEKDAIKAARLPLYQALVGLGIDSAFNNCSAAQIDGIIETVWDAVRMHMQLLTVKGDVPF
jgi:hypothetical protein